MAGPSYLKAHVFVERKAGRYDSFLWRAFIQEQGYVVQYRTACVGFDVSKKSKHAHHD